MDNTQFTIKIITESTCSITRFRGEGDITIPEKMTHKDKMYVVTEIGPYAFSKILNLGKVTLPNTIKTIRINAFMGSSLTAIVLSKELKSIGKEAFLDCSELKEVKIQNGLESLGISAFKNCVNLERIVLPNTVKTIGDYAFLNCEKLSSIVIPDGVKFNKNIFNSSENHISEKKSEPKVISMGLPKPNFNQPSVQNKEKEEKQGATPKVLPKPVLAPRPTLNEDHEMQMDTAPRMEPDVKEEDWQIKISANEVNRTICIEKAKNLLKTANTEYLKIEKREEIRDVAEKLEQAAFDGDTNASYYLGMFYLNGLGTERNINKAITLLVKAAANGNIEAQYQIGLLHLDDNADPNNENAIMWLSKAAENGHVEAQDKLGVVYFEQKDYKQAIKWLKVSASRNVTEASYLIGLCYQNGFGVEMNTTDAAVWYTKAATRNHAIAQYTLALLYQKEASQQQTGSWFNQEMAKSLFIRAAINGVAKAKVEAGKCFFNGYGVKRDYEEALKWFIQAGEKDNEPEAQYLAGCCYLKGKGTEIDEEEAAEWFEMAAAQGFEKAQYQLGLMYKKGTGVIKDAEKAVGLLRASAEQGNAQAQYHLGCCYGEGEGVEKNYNEAITWLKRSLENGYKTASEMLEFYKPRFEKQYLSELGIEDASDDNMYECFTKGQEATNKRNYKSAALYFEKAAEMGHAQAQYYLATFYDGGCGVEQDLQKSFEWYTKSAEAGFYLAQFVLGQRYDLGLCDVEKNSELAVKWYSLAAKSLPVTKIRLGVMFFKGIGTERDYAKAAKLFEEAALIDSSGECKFYLGQCYKNGLGVEKDEAKGQALLEEAKMMGYSNN